MNEPDTVIDHAALELLLPWYVNGTLTKSEHRRVSAHLPACAACRDAVATLRQMRAVVRHPATTPIVPEPRADNLLRGVRRDRLRERALRAGGWLAVAAALATVAILGAGVLAPGTGEEFPFSTLTSGARGHAADYVLELRLEQGAGRAAFERVVELLDGRAAQQSDESTYRLTVTLDARSIEELETVTARVSSLPGIRTARIVAMQLPLEAPE